MQERNKTRVSGKEESVFLFVGKTQRGVVTSFPGQEVRMVKRWRVGCTNNNEDKTVCQILGLLRYQMKACIALLMEGKNPGGGATGMA